MFEQNSYQAYDQANLIGSNPVCLVTALYKGAIDATAHASKCFETGDVMGRSRSVSKVVNILTELMTSLDHQIGGEISANLKRLYSYMQQCVLKAHAEKRPDLLDEVSKLLSEMIQAWYKVAESHGQQCEADVSEGELIREEATPYETSPSTPYGSYYDESRETVLGHSFSF